MRVLLIEPNMANHVLNAVKALSDSDLHASQQMLADTQEGVSFCRVFTPLFGV